MVAALKLFQIVFVIISVSYISGDDSNNVDEFMKKCKKQTSYFLTDQQSLEIDLYYDAGYLTPDSNYILSMCKVRTSFKKVTVNFFVGLCLGRDENGQLQCSNTDKSNTDCTYSYMDACASKLLPDFDKYICCNYEKTDEPRTIHHCFNKQSKNENEFVQCYTLQHPTIKPDEILLSNSKNAFDKFPEMKNQIPIIGFNGQTDACARNMFHDNPEKVVCAMLAQGVEEACNQQ